MKRAVVVLAATGAVAAALALVWVWSSGPDRGAPSAATLARGETLYAKNCASCHGAKLEGQPNWKSRLPTGRMPAPPHDVTGHTWHHADGILFRITKEGPAAVVGGNYVSDMPGFGNVLSDEDIRAVLAFIKSMWPERERQYQAEANRRER